MSALIIISQYYAYSPDTDTIYYKNEPQHFAKKQLELLKLLISNLGKHINEDQIRAVILDAYCSDSVIRSLIKRTRDALKEDIIITTRGVGYRIKQISDAVSSGLKELLFELEKKDYERSLILLKVDNLANIKNALGFKYAKAFFLQLTNRLKNMYSDAVIVKFCTIGCDKLAFLVTNNKDLANAMTNSMANEIIEIGDSFYLSINNLIIGSTFSIGLYTGRHNVFMRAINMLETAPLYGSKLLCGDSHTFYQDIKNNNLELLKAFSASIYNDAPRLFFQPILNNKTDKVENYKRLAGIGVEETYDNFLEIASLMKSASIFTKIIIRKAFEYCQNQLNDIEFLIKLDTWAIEDGLIEHIDYWQEKTNIDPSMIIFEMRESADLRQRDIFKNTIATLKRKGYKIAIGDFGMGYSNFTHIIEEGIDFIKINGLFLKQLENNERLYKIISQIDKLIKACGAKSIAENVCDEETQKLVSLIGIDYSQGSFIQMSNAEITEKYSAKDKL